MHDIHVKNLFLLFIVDNLNIHYNYNLNIIQYSTKIKGKAEMSEWIYIHERLCISNFTAGIHL